jgi:xanthine dehydrogenase YagS FAD-binding subunit
MLLSGGSAQSAALVSGIPGVRAIRGDVVPGVVAVARGKDPSRTVIKQVVYQLPTAEGHAPLDGLGAAPGAHPEAPSPAAGGEHLCSTTLFRMRGPTRFISHAERTARVSEAGGRVGEGPPVMGCGVAPIPWRLTDVEQWLRGTSLSAAVASQAGALAVAHAQPLAKNGHKVPMISAAVERALLRLIPA